MGTPFTTMPPTVFDIDGVRRLTGEGTLHVEFVGDPDGWNFIIDMSEYEGRVIADESDVRALAREALLDMFGGSDISYHEPND